MDYQGQFRRHLNSLHQEGRYRVFADLKRRCGSYPNAKHFTDDGQNDVTVWCLNDYLGMSQHPKVLAAMHEAIDEVGAGSRPTILLSLRLNLPISMARRQRFCLRALTSQTTPRCLR